MNEINPIYFIPIFVVGWIGISCLISLIGGWFWLAKRFPLYENTGPILQNYSWKSISLNHFAGYSSCVNMKITERGLILKTTFLFSILHSPIFLPWPAIKHLTFKKGFFQRAIFRVGKNRLVVYGKVAKIIDKYVSLHK